MGTGSIMNSFYALNPGEDDYAALADYGPIGFLSNPNSTITKEDTDTSVQLNITTEETELILSYPVPSGVTYQSECSETGGAACVKG